jgi:hypothetical protein
LQHFHRLAPVDANKNVAGKKRLLDDHFAAILPTPRDLVQRQVRLDVAGVKLPSDGLFMSRQGIGRKPLGWIEGASLRLQRTGLCPCGFKTVIGNRQGFAILSERG